MYSDCYLIVCLITMSVHSEEEPGANADSRLVGVIVYKSVIFTKLAGLNYLTPFHIF